MYEIIGQGIGYNITNKAFITGEDSFFINEIDKNKCSFGVCDGVGGWKKFSCDSGMIAREMCYLNKILSNIIQEPKTIIENSYNIIKKENKIKAGSTTITSIYIDNYKLKYASIGDSGFLIFRNKKLFYSNIILNTENPPDQLSIIPLNFDISKFVNTPIEEIKHGEINLLPDDIIILATDGLWDNYSDIFLENLDIKNIISSLFSEALKFKKKPDDVTIIICKII